MTKRRAVRRPRRVQLHFWRQGEPTAYVGYTTNVSTMGMFIATNSPMLSGSRIRIEVLGERGFMLEGVVAHARKSRLELAHVVQSGMGVRFLSVGELIGELIPSSLGETEEIPAESGRGAAAASPSLPPSPIVEPSRPEPAAAAPPPLRAPLVAERAREPVRPPATSRATSERPVAPSGGAFSLRFGGAPEFLETYRRDILQGGLFVSTLYPARLQETVHVELFPPLPFTEPVLVRARVVQRFEPDPAGASGASLLAGMGLELLELADLVQRLEPIVQRLGP